MILSVGKSPRATKRFRAIWTDSSGKERHTDFGQPRGYTYIDGADARTRVNYLKRHMANQLERAKIVKLTPSPALFSMYLLWGASQDLQTNIRELNKLFE
jgi:hypothetical protein